MSGTTQATQGGRRIDRLAVATFALAALWLLGIGSLLALYVGRLSLRRLKAEPELRGRTVGWAGVAVAVYGLVMSVLWLGLLATT